MRKLASLQRIVEIKSIPEADRICAYRVQGWWVVDLVGRYSIGDLVVYFEIDSFLPHSLAPFLTKPEKQPAEYLNVQGQRLRTIKLKKQISQGLIMSLDAALPATNSFNEGDDVSELLGIVKWEPPVNAQLAGMARGNFPSRVPKTDADRCQNLQSEIAQWVASDEIWEVTLKLDGSSMTVANDNGEIHVCSRNLSLKLDQEGNSFVDMAKRLDLIEKMQAYPNIAVQGELIGEGIQGNNEKIVGQDFYVFEVYNIVTGEYLSAAERYKICSELGLKHVPVLFESTTLRNVGVLTVDDALKFAEGPSMNPKSQREGVVFKNGRDKWKAISNAWLLKHE